MIVELFNLFVDADATLPFELPFDGLDDATNDEKSYAKYGAK